MLNNLKRRALTLLLSLAMIITYMPTSMIAYAVDGDEDQVQVEQQVEAEKPAEDVEEPKAEQPEEKTSDEVKPEEAKSEEVAAPAEKEASEDVAKPADEEVKAEAKAEAEEEDKDPLVFEKDLETVAVKVTVPADAFSEKVELVVKQLDKANKEDIEAFEEAEKALAENKQTYDGILAFDIHFENDKGDEVEPNGTVSVKMAANKEALKDIAPEAFNADTVQITHIGDKATEVVADTDKKSDIDGTVDVAVTEQAVTKIDAEFDVEAFSIFTLTWEGGSATIHWGELDDGTFNEFEHAILDTSAASVSLENNFDGFSCYGAVYKETEDDTGFGIGMQLHKTDAGWEMDKIVGDGESTHYEKTAIADGSHIYVYYGAKQERPSSEGNPTVHGPTTTKTVTNNDDDTCTIQLDITAPVIHEEDKVGANVIVVLDTTRSMSYNMAGDQTSGVPRAQMRMEAARAALVTLVNSLNMGPNDINFALAEFNLNGSTHSWGQGDWTKSADTVLGYVEGRTQGGGYQLDYTTTTSGTNWEIGLRQGQGLLTQAETNDELKNNKTYVIFVTDGDPNRWVGYNYGNNDYSHNGEAVEHAQDEANDIVRRGAYLYGVFCGSSAGEERLETLINTADGVASISAGSKEAIQAAFQSIAHTIVSDLGSSQVSIDDGVTELSSVSAQVSGPTGGYEYYKKGPNDSDFVEWSGAPGASFSDDNGVTWDLSDVGTLEANTTYRIKFKVWPSQAAYDLIANLNNETQKISDTDITDDVRSQLTVKIGSTTYEFDSSTKRWKPSNDSSSEGVTSAQLQTMIESSNNVEYNLKTNTHLNTSYDYNGVSYTDVVKDVPTGSMLLESELMIVQKMFAHSINAQDPFTSIMFYLKEDGKYYQKDGTTSDTLDETKVYELPVNTNNDWKNQVYIAPGFAEENSDGTLEILEPGHKYSLEEKVLVGNEFEYEFTPQTVRPLVIDGELTYLILKDKYNTPPSGAKQYTIDNETYYVAPEGNDGKLIGTNRKTAELDITKQIVDNTGNFTESQLDAETFTYRVTLTVPKDADVSGITAYEYVPRTGEGRIPVFGYQEDDEETTQAIESDVERFSGKTFGSYTVTAQTTIGPDGTELHTMEAMFSESGDTKTATIDITLKRNEIIRFTNLPAGTEYTITEMYNNYRQADPSRDADAGGSTMPANIADMGYETAVETKSRNPVTQTVRTGSEEGTTVSGTIDYLDVRYYNQFTNTLNDAIDVELTGTKHLDGYEWSGERYYFNLSSEDGPLPIEGAYGRTRFYLTEASGTADKSYSFGKIRFTEPGEYTYTITETDSAGKSSGERSDNITLGGPVTFTITVEEEDGKLVVTDVSDVEGVDFDDDTNTINTTITNKVEKLNIDVTKNWNDSNNQDGVRPEELVVKLIANGVDTGKTIVLNAANNWSASFEGLDKYDDGEAIQYMVEEVLTAATAAYYTPESIQVTPTEKADESGDLEAEFTNSHTPELTEASVKKVWDDANNQDGKRPESLKVTLSNGTEVTLNEANEWTAKVENLPKYADGQEIEYTWTEASIPEYTLTNTQKQGTLTTLTNTHTPEKIDKIGTKIWVDNNNATGARTETILVQLFAQAGDAAAELVRTVTVRFTGTLQEGEIQAQKADDAGNTWNFTFVDVDKFKDGAELVYSIVESIVPTGYTKSENGMTVTNTLQSYPVTVSKTFSGDLPVALIPNFTITAEYGDESVALTKANGTASQDGKTYTWSLGDIAYGTVISFEETDYDVPGYTRDSSADTSGELTVSTENNTFSLTNPYTINTHKVTVEKTFVGITEGDIPEEFEIATTYNGMVLDADNAKSAEGLTYTWEITNVPYNTEIEFKEDNFGVEGYTATPSVAVTGVEEDDYEIGETKTSATIKVPDNDATVSFTNSYECTSFKVTKVWEDNDDEEGHRPTSVTVQLYKDGDEYKDPVELNEDNNWTWTWGPIETGHTYTVDEVAIPSYEKSIGTISDMKDDEGNVIGKEVTITNTYTPPQKKVAKDVDGTKTYIDGKEVFEDDELTYEISYKNTTDAPITVVIEDEIPEFTEYKENTASDGGNFADGKITWSDIEIDPGDTKTVSFVVTVKGITGEPIVNDAVVHYGENDYTTNETTNPTGTPPTKDVFDGTPAEEPAEGEEPAEEPAKTSINNQLVRAGQTLTYEVTYKNTTGEEIDVLTITDSIPDNSTYVADSAKYTMTAGETTTEGTGTADAEAAADVKNLTWTVNTVPNGATVVATFQVTVNEDNGVAVDNTSYVKVGENGPTYKTNTTHNPTPETPVKTVTTGTSTENIDKQPVKIGQVLTYSIYYKNTTGKEVSIKITDDYPSELATYVPDSATEGGTESGGVVTWDNITLADGADITVSFQVKVKDTVSGEILENTGNVRDDTNDFDIDTNKTENPTPRQLVITKKLDNFVVHKDASGKVVNAVFTFKIEGNSVSYGGLYSTVVAMEFGQADAGKSKELVVKGIPYDITGLTVTEIGTANYDVKITSPLAIDEKDGKWKIGFENTYDDSEYKTGVINNYNRVEDENGNVTYETGDRGDNKSTTPTDSTGTQGGENTPPGGNDNM